MAILRGRKKIFTDYPPNGPVCNLSPGNAETTGTLLLRIVKHFSDKNFEVSFEKNIFLQGKMIIVH